MSHRPVASWPAQSDAGWVSVTAIDRRGYLSPVEADVGECPIVEGLEHQDRGSVRPVLPVGPPQALQPSASALRQTCKTVSNASRVAPWLRQFSEHALHDRSFRILVREGGGASRVKRAPPAPHALASSTMLNGVSAARRKREKPAWRATSASFRSPACAPSAAPTSWPSEAGTHTLVENA
jgi:hypothetical protein